MGATNYLCPVCRVQVWPTCMPRPEVGGSLSCVDCGQNIHRRCAQGTTWPRNATWSQPGPRCRECHRAWMQREEARRLEAAKTPYRICPSCCRMMHRIRLKGGVCADCMT